MPPLYELTTLSCPILSVSEVAVGARAFASEDGAAGELLGCWRTEMGPLGRLLLLRGFESAETLADLQKNRFLAFIGVPRRQSLSWVLDYLKVNMRKY